MSKKEKAIRTVPKCFFQVYSNSEVALPGERQENGILYPIPEDIAQEIKFLGKNASKSLLSRYSWEK